MTFGEFKKLSLPITSILFPRLTLVNLGLFENAERPINLVELGIVIDSNNGLLAKAEFPMVSMELPKLTLERTGLFENDPIPITVTVSPRTTSLNFSF